MLKTQAEDRVSAAQYRTDVRREISALSNDIQSVQTDVRITNGQVAEIKPVVAKLEQIRLMSTGATKLAVILSKGAHAISAAVGAILVFCLQWIFAVKK